MNAIMVEWGSEEVLGVGDALLWLSRAGSPPVSSAHRPCPPTDHVHPNGAATVKTFKELSLSGQNSVLPPIRRSLTPGGC